VNQEAPTRRTERSQQVERSLDGAGKAEVLQLLFGQAPQSRKRWWGSEAPELVLSEERVADTVLTVHGVHQWRMQSIRAATWMAG
jgi:hypothetical protein